MQALEEEEKKLISAEKDVPKIEKKILQETAYLQKYEEKERNFLLEHLGGFGEDLVLSKRLDSRWQALDLDALLKDSSRRIARNYVTS